MRTTHTVVTLRLPKDVIDLIAKRLKDAGYAHNFMEPGVMDMTGIALEADPTQLDVVWRTSTDKKAMVGPSKFMKPQPEYKGLKCLLQGPGNVPVVAIYDGDPQWRGVFPLPDILRDDET